MTDSLFDLNEFKNPPKNGINEFGAVRDVNLLRIIQPESTELYIFEFAHEMDGGRKKEVVQEIEAYINKHAPKCGVIFIDGGCKIQAFDEAKMKALGWYRMDQSEDLEPHYYGDA